MKRIDKPVASQIETAQAAGAQADNTRAENTQAENTQAENMQAAWADAWSQQLNRSGEIYGRLFAGMRNEFAAFVQKRLDANMEAARAWSACHSVNEALELQQSWLRSAIEHYSDESLRMSELCRGAIFPAEPETAQHTPEETKAAPERKPSHETHAHIQRAAE